MKYTFSKKAFTIPELLVVTIIIGILSTIGFVSFTSYTSKARDSVRSSDIKNITRVLTLHNSRQAKYPSATDAVEITYTWAVLWTQGVFWKDSTRETWKIFWDLEDPLHKNQYSYSVTNNQKEYQLAAVFENVETSTDLVVGNMWFPKLYETTYASGEFSPLEFSPKIWLDWLDVDGDWATNDNPSDGATVTTWVNKSSAGATNNPTVTDGSIQYTTNWFDGSYPGVFISSGDWVLLNNSDITSGDIFYVVQKNDPFWSTDNNGYGLYSDISTNHKIWYHNRYRNALRIGWAPKFHNKSPATENGSTYPFIYSFHTDNSNYLFQDTANVINQWATNSITWHRWAFNRGWAVTNKSADLVVSEILIYDVSLSTEQRQKVEWYLAHKWGQDYYLPNDHPYKDTPPEWSTPPPTDTTPDAYIFSDVTDADLSTLYTSNSITVTGINTQSPISISWWEYSINSTSSYTSAGWFVTVWDQIRVRWNSSASSSTTTTMSLNIGWVTETYTITTLAADTTPDSITFTSVSDALVSTNYTSNSATISGLNVTVPISITGDDAEYKISDGVPYDVASWGTASASSTYGSNSTAGAFDNNTSSTWWGNNGSLNAWLKYDLGLWNNKVVTRYTLYRSSSQAGWWNWDGYSPRNWIFEWSNDNNNWDTLDTQTNEYIGTNSSKRQYTFSNNNPYRYYRINISSTHWNSNWVNITEMELINEEWSGTFTSASGTVSNGDIISVKMPSSSSAGTLKTAALTVWSTTSNFEITTVAPDTTPDTFSFTDVDNANLNTQYESNSITVSWINSPTAISVSWVWEYRKNGWSYTSIAWTVNNGDVIQVRQSSSASNSITVSSTINIWGVAAVYNVTTPAPPPDTDPDAFSFWNITNASVSTLYTSNSITISGINTATSINISDGEYDINDSKVYTNSAWTVNNGDVISVQNTSSSSPGNTISLTLTVWSQTADFDITTIPPDTIPDAFTVSDISWADINTQYISDPIIVSWINTGTGISIVAWSWEFNIWNGVWNTMILGSK